MSSSVLYQMPVFTLRRLFVGSAPCAPLCLSPGYKSHSAGFGAALECPGSGDLQAVYDLSIIQVAAVDVCRASQGQW